MALHKEMIEQRQNSIIFEFTTILLVFIVVSDFLNLVVARMDLFRLVKYFINASMIFIFIFEMRRIRTKYKYSFIQDQLIIHKIIKENEHLLNVINISDIVYINRCHCIKDMFHFFTGKRYNFYRFGINSYVCIYEQEGTLKRFYFNPSPELLKILTKHNIKCYK